MDDERRDDEPAQAVNPSEAPLKPANESENEPEISALREWFELIGRAAFWALLLYLFVFQVSVVEGPSMQPNFITADRLVIDKLTYRFTDVHRFDVIVFQAVEMDWHPTNRESKDYIKRVIGLPGEHVRFRDHSVYIDGKLLTEPFEFDRNIRYYGLTGEFVVPPKHYFVLGDNRDNSKDSRSSALGFVPESQIRGIARLRFMPLSRWQWFGRH